MADSFITTGTVTGRRTVTLDNDLPLTSGKVRVVVEPISAKNRSNAKEWQDFVAQMFGCLADDPIYRGNSGIFEVRENIE